MSDYRAYDRERDRDRDYSPPRRGGGGGYSSPGRDYSPPSRDEPRRYKSTRTLPRGRGDQDYVEETTFIERGKGPPPRELVPRRRSSSIEDIQRDFPPPSRSLRSYRDDYDDRRRTRSSIGGRSRYDDDYYSDDDDYRSRRGGGRRRDPRDRDDGYYSEDYERETRRGGSRSPRRKSGVEGLLAGLGLGGVAGALTGKGGKDKDRSRSRSRSRYGGRRGSGSRSRSPKNKKERQWAQAAQAAIVAGAVEAFRSRKEPGPWSGEKGKRIATAAIGAGGIDRLIDRDPDEKSKRHLAEAVIGGLAANRLANGPSGEARDRSVDSRGRSRSRPGLRARSRSVIDRFRSKSRGRSRSVSSEDSRAPRARSKSMGGIQKALAGGAVAAAGKAIYDRVRSKSRGAKDRRRSRSDSEDSYVASRNRRRDVGPSSQRSRSLGPNDGAVVGPRGRAAAADGGAAAIEAGDSHGRGGKGDRSSSSGSESSTDLENKRKKMRGKEFLTAGLASIATIHAAHGVYQSMDASEKRHKLVAEGEMSPEEARKKRSKAWLQDAAAVGIAALGIKGAYSEWKEMNEQRHSVKELEERREQRHQRRARRMREMKSGLGGSGGGDRGRDERRSRSEDDYYDDRRYGRGSDRYDDGPYSSGGLPPPPIPAGGYR